MVWPRSLRCKWQAAFGHRGCDSSTGTLTSRCSIAPIRNQGHSQGGAAPQAQTQAGAGQASPGNSEACHAFVMLLVPGEEVRLCGSLGGQGMNSWRKKGTNRRDWHQGEPPLHLRLYLPSHSVGLSVNWRGSSKSFCEFHWVEGFCEHFSARRSHYLLYTFGFFKYWSFPRWLAVLKLNIASGTKNNTTHTPVPAT